MNPRSTLLAIILVLLVVPSAFTQPLRARNVIGQNTVVPGCPGSGDELKPPTELTADDNHVLSTTFDVTRAPQTVPVYVKKNNVWSCSEKIFNLRMYRDPVSGTPRFPGPTLHVNRATDARPGDSIRVLLKNNLAPSNEQCVWAKGNCDCTNPDPSKRPQCCSNTTEPNGMNCFHGDNTTNLHFHGTHVSPQKPQDWVLLQLTPAGTAAGSVMHGSDEISGEFQYALDPLTASQSEGTHWYHPHKHGSTAEQVGNGMAGAIIIEGPFDQWLRAQFKQPLREKLMVIQQVHDLNFIAPAGETFSPIPLINGQFIPQVTMYRGEIQRWRLVNANIDAAAQFSIDFDGIGIGAAAAVQARQIAMDGVQFSPKNYQCQPLLDITPCDGVPSGLTFQTSPGNRADFLVKAPDAIGEFFVPYEVFGNVQDQGTRPLEDGRRGRRVERGLTREALDAVAPGSTQPALLSVNVVDCPAGMDCAMNFPADDQWPALPYDLRPIVPNRPTQNVQFQILDSDGDQQRNPAPDGFFGIRVKGVNDDKMMQFDDRCAAFTEPLDPDGGEEWHVSQNLKRAAPFHVFHIHTNPFQVVSTFDANGNQITYPEPIWMDSITLPSNQNPTDPDHPKGEVVIRQRFEDYTGLYVLHCHFLGHEDRGMMLSVQTVCPNQTDSYSVTSATQKECTFGQFLPALKPCPMPAQAHAH
ncbi:MAG: multicopper oxidase family protein [Thermoanaerobaculia bacterium]